MDMIKNSFARVTDWYKGVNRYIKTGAFLAVAVFCVAVALVGSGIGFGYSVKYNGQKIAVIEDKDIYWEAVKNVENKVSGDNIKKVLSSPEFSLTLTLLSSTQKDKNIISDGIIKNTKEIVNGVKATVNDKSYIFAVENKNDIVENYLSKYDVGAISSKSAFVGDVNFEDGLFLLSDTEKETTLNSLLDTVDVITVANVVSSKETDYNTIEVRTSELVKGTTQVKCEGAKGTNQVVEEVSFLNGVETGRVTLSEDVITKPVDRVVLVGTSASVQTAQNSTVAHNSGFIFPIWDAYKLGSPFGDGRAHKGYDILADKGTPIHVAKSGTVIRASWYGGYGNCVDVDHGNGIVTRYGHASEFCCRVGQTVSAGDVIAKVGTTGNSSGNHVHFEVIINGNRVDPAPYLNIN